MKHIGIKDLDTAVEELYKQIDSIDTIVEMDDKETWCQEVKNYIISGELQVFQCKNHYVLVEHGYYPIRNSQCIFVINPQCDECRRAGEQLAGLRDLDMLAIMKYDKNGMTITAEKLV